MSASTPQMAKVKRAKLSGANRQSANPDYSVPGWGGLSGLQEFLEILAKGENCSSARLSGMGADIWSDYWPDIYLGDGLFADRG